jgi:hypothetical protein
MHASPAQPHASRVHLNLRPCLQSVNLPNSQTCPNNLPRPQQRNNLAPACTTLTPSRITASSAPSPQTSAKLRRLCRGSGTAWNFCDITSDITSDTLSTRQTARQQSNLFKSTLSACACEIQRRRRARISSVFRSVGRYGRSASRRTPVSQREPDRL